MVKARWYATVRRFREGRARLLAKLRRENRLLERQVAAMEAERDRLRVLAQDRLQLLLEQARVWRVELREAESREATAAMVESGVPTLPAESAEVPS